MDTDPHSDDGDLFRRAWFALGLGLFTLTVFGAVGVDQWYMKATVRPADEMPAEGMTDGR